MIKDIKYQSVALEEYKPQFWSCQNCFCGICVESCPAYQELHHEAVSARGLAQMALALLSGELELSEMSEEILYACVGCRWCETVCSMNAPLHIKQHGTRGTKVSGATMGEILRSLKILEGGKIPAEIRDVLVSLAKYGNPYGVREGIKDDWIARLGITLGDTDTILYVGATVPYEDRSCKMAEAVIEVFKAGGLHFAMLGSEEKDSGAFARMMGEEWLFHEMVEHNTRILKEHQVGQVICLSPHDYDAFNHYYEDLEGIEVKHYTHALWEMIEGGKLQFNEKLEKRVTYHDPCYLGRQSSIYDEPRKILQSVPAVQLVEMQRSRETALCCGGGGTGLFLEVPNVRIDKARADQVKEVDPDCLAVACPNCYQMLDSAIKSRNYAIEVRDIGQVVLEAIGR